MTRETRMGQPSYTEFRILPFTWLCQYDVNPRTLNAVEVL